jgi:hypothetical protein
VYIPTGTWKNNNNKKTNKQKKRKKKKKMKRKKIKKKSCRKYCINLFQGGNVAQIDGLASYP